MTQQNRQFVFGAKPSPMGSIGALLIFFGLMIGLYFIVKGAYWLLGILAPVLLIATLIMDYKVVTGFIQTLWNLLKRNVLGGLIAILLTIVGAPFVAGYLFAKAWVLRTLKKADPNMRKEKYDDYVEVKTEKKDADLEEEDFLILPPVEKVKPEVKNNDYDDLFK